MQTAIRQQSFDAGLGHFLVEHHIDSFNKVWFLLFLWQRTEHAVNRAFATIATFSDERTLDETIGELEDAGLLTVRDGRCVLSRESDVETGLSVMLSTYEDPIARQQLLSRLYRHSAIRVD